MTLSKNNVASIPSPSNEAHKSVIGGLSQYPCFCYSFNFLYKHKYSYLIVLIETSFFNVLNSRGVEFYEKKLRLIKVQVVFYIVWTWVELLCQPKTQHQKFQVAY